MQRVAFVCGYDGAGYFGLQRQPDNTGRPTVEQELERALVAAGALQARHAGALHKVNWSRTSRTDKGVSAAANVVSLDIPSGAAAAAAAANAAGGRGNSGGGGGGAAADLTPLVNLVNAALPSAVKVWTATRPGPNFEARRAAYGRRYEYLVPVWALDPSLTPLELKRLNLILEVFVGSHCFHNFTSEPADDPRELRRTIHRAYAEGPVYLTTAATAATAATTTTMATISPTCGRNSPTQPQPQPQPQPTSTPGPEPQSPPQPPLQVSEHLIPSGAQALAPPPVALTGGTSPCRTEQMNRQRKQEQQQQQRPEQQHGQLTPESGDRRTVPPASLDAATSTSTINTNTNTTASVLPPPSSPSDSASSPPPPAGPCHNPGAAVPAAGGAGTGTAAAPRPVSVTPTAPSPPPPADTAELTEVAAEAKAAAGDDVPVAPTPYVRIVFVGCGFLMHQIRRMVGLALAVARRTAPPDCMRTALDPARPFLITVPTAPPTGLIMDRAFFAAGPLEMWSFLCGLTEAAYGFRGWAKRLPLHGLQGPQGLSPGGKGGRGAAPTGTRASSSGALPDGPGAPLPGPCQGQGQGQEMMGEGAGADGEEAEGVAGARVAAAPRAVGASTGGDGAGAGPLVSDMQHSDYYTHPIVHVRTLPPEATAEAAAPVYYKLDQGPMEVLYGFDGPSVQYFMSVVDTRLCWQADAPREANQVGGGARSSV
ncbi:hypothetical protein VOLCADRAFT_94649 [Volvox carteri f. nagariensis]|uniref:Pseudouridine synthase I TruA alpha/beta domain-containing protein n=1 Tax=Volvox carteri f. nagariensis TaxID=3068 RepID=D8U5C8_VOLCA|nr:uncharacterized protein VOLCADRAFT_94649 [Volvox carteri f. nagariensis]EFJ45191.1 hypothetical protein VOLCADRAFT_94649 [Volvox carteri f. nagariensis]|eukprot:XP_002953867.1 hypothetical protein VOLCADRAFT_94649 [Volvox carteri f. nagariensis]